MKAFLYHVLNNLIVTIPDAAKRRRSTPYGERIRADHRECQDLIESLDGKAAMVFDCAAPQAYQKVMRMRYVQDLSLKEMSFITGQSRNALAVQAHRGLEKLKVLYGSA